MEGDSLVVQGFGLRGFTAWGPGTIPGRGAKILQAYMVWAKKKKKFFMVTSSLSTTWLGSPSPTAMRPSVTNEGSESWSKDPSVSP